MEVVIGKSRHDHLILHDAKDYAPDFVGIVDIPESLVSEHWDARRRFNKLQECIRRMARDQGVDL